MGKSMKPRISSPLERRAEDSIQQEIFMWYNNNYCLLHHSPRRLIFSVPNEGKPELVRTGLYPGASDLLVFHTPSRPPLFIEVKTPSGIQSPNQKEFEAHATSLGYEYYLVRSLEDFQGVIAGISEMEQPVIW